MSGNPERLWTKNFILLLGTAVFMYISMFMFTPTLPLFARNLGASDPALGGLIVFVYTLGALIPRVFWGQRADTWGRKPVYLTGAVIMLVGTPLLGAFGAVWGILVFRSLQGVGFSAGSTSAATIAVDLTPASRRAEGVGYYSLANTVGMAIGPLLGLTVLGHFGNSALLVTGTLAGALCLGLGTLMGTGSPTPRVSAPLALGTLIEKSVLKNALVMFFLTVPYGALMGFIASYGADRGVAEVGLYFSTYAIALFLIRLVAGKIADRRGPTVVLLPGMLAMFTGLVVLFWADNLGVFLLSALLFGLGFGVTQPVLQSSAFLFCPPERRGAGNATIFTILDLALGLGALGMGLAIKFLGYPLAFAGFGVFVVVGAVLYLTLLHKPLKERRLP